MSFKQGDRVRFPRAATHIEGTVITDNGARYVRVLVDGETVSDTFPREGIEKIEVPPHPSQHNYEHKEGGDPPHLVKGEN